MVGHQEDGKELRRVALRTCVGSCRAPPPAAFGWWGKGMRDNRTSTTKYNLVTFLPKALFEQYRRLANIFFSLQVALSLMSFSPIRPFATITPLVIVLGVSLIKEALEDYKRYKQDRELNSRVVLILSPESGSCVERSWADVRVGDVVKVLRDEQMPADMVFLCAEGGSVDGTCYVETMNLDGETNLKMKAVPDAVKGLRAEALPSLDAVVECEGPNARLYQFTGNLLLHGAAGQGDASARKAAGQGGGAGRPAASAPPAPVTVPLPPSAVLLRGCMLRNTGCVYGAVVYAGHDTKVFMNATQPPSKRSRLERSVDKIILAMFAVLFAWCLVSALLNSAWTVETYPRHWYMRPDAPDAANDASSRVKTGAVNFFVALVLYSYLIPISLYVSMEMVKVAQAMVFINLDRHMYDPSTDTPALARTSNLNEELGMVNTILTDKTGTLTRNIMEVFKCSIAGVAYGAGVTEVERSNAMRLGKPLAPPLDAVSAAAAARHREPLFNFYDPRIMGSAWQKEADPATIEMFFRLLAVCHTVIPDGPAKEAEIRYDAESPDEAALVVAAKAFGFFFHRRTSTSVTVRERTGRGVEDVEYEVLNVIEFNASRKRMSVVARKKGSGRVIIFTKGADTVIYERLDPRYVPNAAMKASTARHMEEFGSAGLRTLCLSYAEVDAAWYESDWQPKWVAAKASLQEREAKVEALAEEIERNLRLLGCTAIEDKLQEGVAGCIKQLALAGIRIWVLTGDKMETAVNIGFACSLLTEDMHQVQVRASSAEAEALEAAGDRGAAERCMRELVERQLDQADEALGPASTSGGKGRGSGSGAGTALVIDGQALSFALTGGLAPKLLRVGMRCKAVVCCRVSPLQKAQVTALVRSHGDTTLAVGDGANDVGMIQKAHIGVGISGQEGMQAVMSADFAIAQFRFLVPLLLVHGHWSYRRFTRMVLFFFYKNMLFGLTLFIYSAFTSFSGSYLYDDTSMTMYNAIFTAGAPIVIGIFDRPVDRAMLLAHPQLYRSGLQGGGLGLGSIAAWMGAACLQGAVVLGLALAGLASVPAAGEAGGGTFGMAQLGVVVFTGVVVTVHLQLAVVVEQWTWPHVAVIGGSVGIWWTYLLLFGRMPLSWSLDVYRLFDIVGPSPQYWLYGVLLLPVAAVLPSFALHALSQLLAPSDDQIIREVQLQQSRQAKKAGPATSPSASSTAAPSRPPSGRKVAPAPACSDDDEGEEDGKDVVAALSAAAAAAKGSVSRSGSLSCGALRPMSVSHAAAGAPPGQQADARAAVHSVSPAGEAGPHAAASILRAPSSSLPMRKHSSPSQQQQGASPHPAVKHHNHHAPGGQADDGPDLPGAVTPRGGGGRGKSQGDSRSGASSITSGTSRPQRTSVLDVEDLG